MTSLPANKEISFSFNKDTGFVQSIAPRTETSGCFVEVAGTLSASLVKAETVVITGTISASSYEGVQGYTGPTITQGTCSLSYNDFNFQMSFPPSGIPSRWTRIDNVVTIQHVMDIAVFASASTPDVAITNLPFSIETPSELFGQVVMYSQVSGVRTNTACQGFSDQSDRIRLLMFSTLETGSGRITNTWTYTTTD